MRISLLALGAGLLLASIARADTVAMKDGRTLHGEIVVENDQSVVLKMKGIQVTLKREEIDAIHKGEAQDGGGAAGADDPVASRFSRTGQTSVDAARAASLDLWRALEKADSEAKKDASDPSGLRGQLASAQKKLDAMGKEEDALRKKVNDTCARFNEEVGKYNALC